MQDTSIDELESALQALTVSKPRPIASPQIDHAVHPKVSPVVTESEHVIEENNVETDISTPESECWEDFDVEPKPEDCKPLRRYQERILRRLMKLHANPDARKDTSNPSALVYLPTGGGKTRIAAELCRSFVQDRQRCLFVVNRNKLASQAVESFCKVGLRRCVAVFKAGYAECLSRPIQVTSIQSLQSECREYPPAALVIVDEAHCAISDSFTELIAHYKAHNAFIVGLTATPLRLDPSESLSTVFHKLIKGPSITELVSQGVVVPPIVHYVSGTSVRDALKRQRKRQSIKVGKQKEYTRPPTLTELICCEEMVKQAVATWRRVCSDRKTIAFCVDIPHSRAVAAEFARKRIRAAHIDGSAPERERAKIFAAFSSGAVQVLTSVGVLCEGFDEPDITAVMLLRPTQSKGLYIQMVGRGLRCAPSKHDCIVLDQAGNTMVHGPITGPEGYVPEPWGSEDGDCDGAADTTIRKHHKHKPLWKLTPCLAACGAMLHSGLRYCPACVRKRYSDTPRQPLADKTNITAATTTTTTTITKPTEVVCSSEISLFDIVIPRKPTKVPQ